MNCYPGCSMVLVAALWRIKLVLCCNKRCSKFQELLSQQSVGCEYAYKNTQSTNGIEWMSNVCRKKVGIFHQHPTFWIPLQEMLSEVSHVTDKFILRRTNRLNARFLPPKQIFNVQLGQ